MNRTSVVMIASTILLYAGTLFLFNEIKCWSSIFNPTNFPVYHTLLCNH